MNDCCREAIAILGAGAMLCTFLDVTFSVANYFIQKALTIRQERRKRKDENC